MPSMADEILKAYGERKYSDEVQEIIDFDPELGFNPYVWMSRKLIQKTLEENGKNPALLAAYEKYRESMKRIESEEFMKGQAPGL